MVVLVAPVAREVLFSVYNELLALASVLFILKFLASNFSAVSKFQTLDPTANS